MALLLTTLCLSASLLAAQQPDGPPLATRERLGAELARLEGERGSGARAQAVQIRQRLASGDFQVGDRILIRVDGEPQLSDTFTVQEGPALALPQLGSVSLRGVLRSELEGRVETHLAQYLRSPVVQVRPLVRILVEGDVVRPGFYSAAPQQPLADLLSQAGGISARAKVSQIRVERGTQRIWSGRPLEEAMGRGYSLDQLNLQAGDRLYVPLHGDPERTWRILGIAVTLPLAIYSLTRIR
jgi:protein involved in polysaccharide export with SLBB domain